MMMGLKSMKKKKLIHITMTLLLLTGVGCVTSSKKHQKKIPYVAANPIKKSPVPSPKKPILQQNHSQMKPIEKFKPLKKGGRASATTISKANKQAKQKPDSSRYINAIAIYDYVPGQLYQIYTSPLHITDIQLATKEQLTCEPAAGDTMRWFVGRTRSGTGANMREHVLIKPLQEGLTTNLILLTDQHEYHLEIKSFKTTYQAAVRWRYPMDEFKTLKSKRAQQIAKDANVITHKIDLKHLNFNYQIKGKASWAPIKCFDDNLKTYIQFPASIRTDELPLLFIASENKSQLVNYRYQKGFYIVDRLFQKAMLKLGKKKTVYVINKGRLKSDQKQTNQGFDLDMKQVNELKL